MCRISKMLTDVPLSRLHTRTCFIRYTGVIVAKGQRNVTVGVIMCPYAQVFYMYQMCHKPICTGNTFHLLLSPIVVWLA